MVHRDTITDLYRHMEWADAAVWAAVLASEQGPADTKLRALLYHLHIVQRAFLRAWRGEEPNAAFPEFTEAAALLAWGRSYYNEAEGLLATLDDDALAAPWPMPWAELVAQRLGRTPETTTLGETALQVALHSQYHRGQINARLREVGGTPPLVDYIAWVWLGRPAAEWPPA